jgi:hypothetical protein
MVKIKVKLILLLVLVIIKTNCQSGIGDANLCAKTLLKDKLPVKRDECWTDKSDTTKNCCFISAFVNGLNFNMCAGIPKGSDVNEIITAIKSFGADTTIECSSVYLKFSFYMIFLIFNLF